MKNKNSMYLCGLLDIQSPELAIVFGRTKSRVDEVADGLIKRGYSAEGIHGILLKQNVIKSFAVLKTIRLILWLQQM